MIVLNETHTMNRSTHSLVQQPKQEDYFGDIIIMVKAIFQEYMK